MNKYSNTIYNIRFKKCFTNLVALGFVKNKSDMANIIGTYNHKVSHILSGKFKPTIKQLLKLCEHFRLDANFFFGKNVRMFIEHPHPVQESAHRESEKLAITKAYMRWLSENNIN